MIRVLHDPPLDGPTNMARDEALMTRVGAAESPPTLRLYQWEPPTISLGYFQRYAEYESLVAPAGALPVVRRLTGGGAILHDLELTYSLTLPATHPLVSNKPNRLYELVQDALVACLGALGLSAVRCDLTDDSGPARGPFFCFARRHSYDVLIGQDKIAGSAQRRTRKAILQHGSIIVGNRLSVTASSPAAPGTDRLHRTMPPTLALPFEKAPQVVRSTFVQHLGKRTGERFAPAHWSEAELAAADSLVPKYAGDEWTKRA